MEPEICILGQYSAAAWMCRNGTKKANAQLELSLEREAKSQGTLVKKGRLKKMYLSPIPLSAPINETRELVTVAVPQKES